MDRRFLRPGLLLCLMGTLVCPPPEAFAQPFTTYGTYELLPRFSVLRQSGGFAGQTTLWRLSGEYTVDPSVTAVSPPESAISSAEIWGGILSPNPAPAIALDVDETLGLIGLRGRQLPVMGPYDAFQYRGKTPAGSAISLLTVAYGPWMFARGSTTAPAGSADFFDYDFRWVGWRGKWQDTNNDAVIDAADYTGLRDWAANDYAGSLAEWRAQFGTEPDTAMLEGMSNQAALMVSEWNVAAIPEPGTVLIAAIAGGALLLRRNRR